MTDRVYVCISGRVQGVGFRYATREEALSLGLAGWVRNLPDGRVEAEFEGPKEVLEQMVAWCHSGPRLARVTHVETEWDTGDPKYQAFHYRG
jgi:acylphosphatase